MKRSLLAVALCLAGAPALAVCPYPLDASAAQIAAAYATPFPIVSGQHVEAPTPVAPGGIVYLAMSDTGAAGRLSASGDLPVPASGTMAVELNVDQFPAAPTGGSTSLVFGLTAGNPGAIFDPDSNILYLEYGVRLGTSLELTLTGMNKSASGTMGYVHASYPLAFTALPANFRLGFYVEAATRRVGITAGGQDLGFILQNDGQPFTVPAGIANVALMVQNNPYRIEVGDPLVGQPVVATLVTDAALMTSPFPAGTQDFCGATVGAPVGTPGISLPNGKLFRGKGQPRGLLKRQ